MLDQKEGYIQEETFKHHDWLLYKQEVVLRHIM